MEVKDNKTGKVVGKTPAQFNAAVKYYPNRFEQANEAPKKSTKVEDKEDLNPLKKEKKKD